MSWLEEILAVLVCGKVAVLSDEQPATYSLAAESREALDGMGLYFEELPLLTRGAFNEVGQAIKPSPPIN